VTAISLEHVTKVYPTGHKAVDDVDLSVRDGELLVLVGPSGCGKTTVLRMVAGLEEITAGTLRIGDRVANQLAPKDRNIAMVFQNYALYPHMTVAANIGFALRVERLPKADIRRRIQEVTQLLGLADLLDKRPAQLSGGQRQRVAMGRAIVRSPTLFLMDEPLSNLDAQLRVQMRAEISRLQRHLEVATLFVTHDQTEAMTLGDRIAVMRKGILQQIDAPQVVYDRPASMFVAEFIGSPAMNLYRARLLDGTLRLGSQTLDAASVISARPELAAYNGRDLVVGIRPEHLRVTGNDVPTSFKAEVNLVESLGSDALVHFAIDAPRVHTEAREDETDAVGPGTLDVTQDGVARVEPQPGLSVGGTLRFAVDGSRLYFFDLETGNAI
jgi:multiple sugar transport system ATP-binding protein